MTREINRETFETIMGEVYLKKEYV
jgi:hypothetical protein